MLPFDESNVDVCFAAGGQNKVASAERITLEYLTSGDAGDK